MVVVNIKTNGNSGDGQRLDLRIVDLLGNNSVVRMILLVLLKLGSLVTIVLLLIFVSPTNWKENGPRTPTLLGRSN